VTRAGNVLRAAPEASEDMEGSRFNSRQFYELAAGGSRE